MNTSSKRLKIILEKFLEKLDLYGVCGFWVTEEETDYGPSLAVYLVIDEEFVKNSQIRPDHLGRGMRDRVKNKIKDFLGLENIYVGSITKNCNEVKS